MVAKQLGRLLVDWIWSETDVSKDTEFLGTVPSEPEREASRGFIPPDILAEAIRDYPGVLFLEHVLRRNNSLRPKPFLQATKRESCFVAPHSRDPRLPEAP